MKKIKWSVLVFFVLALLLSAGTSYLALEQNAVTKEKAGGTKKLSIALINQDEGVIIDGKKIQFGKELMASVVNRKDQDWQTPLSDRYAEMGLKSGIYDLMITIPAGFSKQTMSPLDPSVTAVNPEKARLVYQISKTGNKDAEAEAERVALEKLNELNGQIIDVYFSTILASLHSAQDSIKKLVDKEETYGSVYNDHVNSPLSNYTQQFKTVQDYTGMSKESFRGLQDILKGFGTGLADGTKVNETYFQSLEKLAKNQETNALVTKSFAEQMTQNDSAMSTGDVSEQLANLKNSNDEIYRQFQKMEEERTLSTQVDSVQKYLDTVNEQVSMINTEVTTKLGDGLSDNVKRDLLNYISEQDSGTPRKISLDDLTDNQLNNLFNREIRETMEKIQNYDPTIFRDDMQDVNEYRNVIALAKLYEADHPSGWSVGLFQRAKPIPENDLTENAIEKLIAEKKRELESNDAHLGGDDYYSHEITLDLNFRKSDEIGDQQTIYFKPPTGFVIPDDSSVILAKLTDANKNKIGEAQYDNVLKRWYIELDKDATDGDAVAAELTVTLYIPKEDLDTLDLLAPIQLDVLYEQTREDSTNPLEPVILINKEQMATDLSYIITPSEVQDATEDAIKGITKELADKTATYVSPYYKLSELFKTYYGVDATGDIGYLEGQRLEPYVGDEGNGKHDSYYYQFKVDRITAIVSKITDNVTRFIHRDLVTFQQQIDESQTRIATTKDNANTLTDRLNETTTQAATMNVSVAKMLENVEAWRKASLDLLDKGGVVVTNTGDEKSATLALGSEFQGLLLQSKSLADSSKTNLNSADNVYKTFDAIDKQAKNIQNSGLGIVTQAQRLSLNMADKLGQDQTFSGNFSEVMSNSRVGDRQNEQLNSFLSNPVTKEKGMTIAAGDTFTPYLIVLVCFIVALFTGYVIASQERKRKQEDDFEEEMALAYQNTPITLLTLGIGLIEGAIIGAISAYFLDLKNVMFVSWMGIIILIMLVFVMVATYLLRQLRMVGMFLLLVILAMYLFLTEAVGLKIDKDSILATIRLMSPLQYVENMLNGFAIRSDDWLVLMYSLIGAAVAGVVVNLFVWHRSKHAEGDDEDE
ncbi:type VII secretion protein EsaA [Listeria grandensis]|uniref:type VII secretion protein EsaA n=1 Tax=Listeria grandensis TaxID=1494963 RepID=UPI0016264843|nr:type VII secretion protein EsaA [Listeria grandensis]MBC1475251.1 type VII secretion protein EsaA [Listeria grandensis]